MYDMSKCIFKLLRLEHLKEFFWIFNFVKDYFESL